MSEGLAFGESQPGRSCYKPRVLTNLCVNEDDMNASPSPLSPQGHMDEAVQAPYYRLYRCARGPCASQHPPALAALLLVLGVLCATHGLSGPRCARPQLK